MYKGKIDLVFLWNKENFFESPDINLSNKFFLEYDYENKILRITKKENFMEDFWNGENISITGIVGENGSGKTTIMKYIRNSQNIIQSNKEEIRVYFIGNRLEVYCKKCMIKHISYNNEIINPDLFNTIENSIKQENSMGVYKENEFEYKIYSVDNLFIININYNEKKDDYNYKYVHLKPSQNMTVVYHNNLISYFKDLDESKMGFYTTIDLSTDFLLRFSKSKFQEAINYKFLHRYNNNIFIKDSVDHFIIEEQMKTLKFLSKEKELFNKILSFKTLDRVNCTIESIEIINDKEKRTATKIEQIGIQEKYKMIKKFIIGFQYSDDVEYSVANFIGLYLYDIYGVIEHLSSVRKELHYIKDLVQKVCKSNNLKETVTKLIELRNEFSKLKLNSSDITFELDDIELNYILNFVDFILKNGSVENNNKLMLNFSIDKFSNKEFFMGNLNLENITDMYEKSNLIKRYIVFDYSDLSSGEKNLLILYSRIYELVNNDKYRLNLNKNLIILLDEPDVALHPEWNRRLVDSILTFTSGVFGEEYNIKIIISTHSPFIISDIPNEDIIFLKFNREQFIRKIVYKSNDEEQTFASNIHSLFSNSFFLKSTLGEFSYNKIARIIEVLQDRNIKLSEFEQEKISYIIKLIGEPILKNKLQQLYDEKIYLQDSNIDKEIDILKEKIKRLEKKKNQGENYD